MQCTDCPFTCQTWYDMVQHYDKKHPDVDPSQYFTKDAKKK